MTFEACERETILQIDDESKQWEVYTRQSTMMTKLNKIVKPYKTIKEDGRVIEAYYRLEPKQVSFRKIIEMTEEQRQKKRETMLNNLSKINDN